MIFENLLKTFSPRISASYLLSEKLSANFSTGRFSQRPPYTALGYKDDQGNLVNRENGITYIFADHVVAGIDFSPDEKSKISIEGFYKSYRNYPFSVADSVALASKGDFEFISSIVVRALM